jgi:hypothetical protein
MQNTSVDDDDADEWKLLKFNDNKASILCNHHHIEHKKILLKGVIKMSKVLNTTPKAEP